MNKLLTWGAVTLGIVFIILAGIYWTMPAGALPTYLPGFILDSMTIHFKHGLGSLILALALFAFAWFSSAPKNAN